MPRRSGRRRAVAAGGALPRRVVVAAPVRSRSQAAPGACRRASAPGYATIAVGLSTWSAPTVSTFVMESAPSLVVKP